MDLQSLKQHALDILKAAIAAAAVTFLTTILQDIASLDLGGGTHALQTAAGFAAIKAKGLGLA